MNSKQGILFLFSLLLCSSAAAAAEPGKANWFRRAGDKLAQRVQQYKPKKAAGKAQRAAASEVAPTASRCATAERPVSHGLYYAYPEGEAQLLNRAMQPSVVRAKTKSSRGTFSSSYVLAGCPTKKPQHDPVIAAGPIDRAIQHVGNAGGWLALKFGFPRGEFFSCLHFGPHTRAQTMCIQMKAVMSTGTHAVKWVTFAYVIFHTNLSQILCASHTLVSGRSCEQATWRLASSHGALRDATST